MNKEKAVQWKRMYLFVIGMLIIEILAFYYISTLW